jgi:two-component system chemotaxis response regulator CheB
MMTSSSDASRRRAHAVLIVDDSDLMRSLLREYVVASGPFEVVGEAATGYEAIRLIHSLNPAVVTLDLEMPDLGGIEVLGYIMSEVPRPVVIISSHTAALADPALRAMMMGAVEFVAKPCSQESREVALFRERLQQALHAAATAHLLNLPVRQLLAQRRAAPPAGHRAARCAVGIAASTGGPRALAEVLPMLPAELPAAVLVVQHMPAAFTAALARRFGDICALETRQARPGELVEEGVIYIAPGGQHLDLERGPGGVRTRLTEDPPLWGVRPAADVLFAAIARTFGPASIGVVLTGMGRDGADGCRILRDAGGAVIVQDAATSVIPSMPGAASAWAGSELPLDQLADAITRQVALQARTRTAP